MQTVLQGEASMKVPCLLHWTVFLLTEPTLIIKEFLESYLDQLDWDFPSPVNSAAISPSASSLTNQSGSVLTSQDHVLWTDETANKDLESSFVWERSNQEPGGDFFLYKSETLWLREHTFPFHWRLKTAFPQLELRHQRHLSGMKRRRAGGAEQN